VHGEFGVGKICKHHVWMGHLSLDSGPIAVTASEPVEWLVWGEKHVLIGFDGVL
jgi:hypothetical protein